MSLTTLFHDLLHGGAGKTPMTSKQANELLLKAVRKRNVKMAARALTAGASPNLKCDWPDGGYRPILLDMVLKDDLPMVQLLIRHGAALEETYEKMRPLLHAVIAGHTPIVRALLDAGADYQAWHCGRTAESFANQYQYADIAKMLKDEPGRRSQIAADAARAKQEAEAARLAAVEKEKLEAAARAAAPPDQTTQVIEVMKPLTFKTAKRKGLFA